MRRYQTHARLRSAKKNLAGRPPRDRVLVIDVGALP
jgi:hypothetical protein